MNEDIIDCKYAVLNRIACLVNEFQIDIHGLYFTNTENYLFTVNLEFMFNNNKYKITNSFKEKSFRYDLKEFSYNVENEILNLIDN